MYVYLILKRQSVQARVTAPKAVKKAVPKRAPTQDSISSDSRSSSSRSSDWKQHEDVNSGASSTITRDQNTSPKKDEVTSSPKEKSIPSGPSIPDSHKSSSSTCTHNYGPNLHDCDYWVRSQGNSCTELTKVNGFDCSDCV